MNVEQWNKVAHGTGLLAALDQSGGSTAAALRQYGFGDEAYRDDAEMFDLIHNMRTRLIMSPGFDGDRIIGAILFESTMERSIDGISAVDYLWEKKAGSAVPQGGSGPGRR